MYDDHPSNGSTHEGVNYRNCAPNKRPVSSVLSRIKNPLNNVGKTARGHSTGNGNGVASAGLRNGRGGGLGEKRYDARFKVLLLGDSGVGKTSLLRSLMDDHFDHHMISTIGIDFANKIFNVDGHRVNLEIWDTAGQEAYYCIVASHFREAKAFIIVYDVTKQRTFDQIQRYWLQSLDQEMNEPIPVFFTANKSDLVNERVVSTEVGEKLASQQCAHGYFETSAKTSQNVHELFQSVANSMVSTWSVPGKFYEVMNGGTTSAECDQNQPFRVEDSSNAAVNKRSCCQK